MFRDALIWLDEMPSVQATARALVPWLILCCSILCFMSALIAAGFFRYYVHAWFALSCSLVFLRALSITVVERRLPVGAWSLTVWGNMILASLVLFVWLVVRIHRRTKAIQPSPAG